MGVLIFEGMKVGIQEGDFTISVDKNDKFDSNLILSTSYNILPIWLRIAHENILLSHKANEDISTKWCEEKEIQKELLLAELTPSIQVSLACGTALDAIYDQLREFAHITQQDIDTWKSKKTARSAQIAEIIRRVYKLDKDMTKAFK